ncbi:NTP transferase domain-containing protein [Candidatus Bathyarchaeota archaeon]|nr:NTP transferase domain-containing protein [Candidatus Bathyarchaeota archaeon]
MDLTTLIMAGGKGSRMKIKCEKPLIKIMNKPMFQWVVEAVKKSKVTSKIIIAVSKNTRKTGKIASKLMLKVIETPGEGYISDYQYVIKKLNLKDVLILPSDIPLIGSKTIKEIITYYIKSDKPALSVMVPLTLFKKLGLTPDYIFNINGVMASPIGINVINGTMIKKAYIEEEILVLNKAELAINVNTIHELKLINEILNKKYMRQHYYKNCTS